jgi:hypothetical protein
MRAAAATRSCSSTARATGQPGLDGERSDQLCIAAPDHGKRSASFTPTMLTLSGSMLGLSQLHIAHR